MIYISGKTTEGKNVYSGVWAFHATHGIPLDIIFEKIDGIVDWVDFFISAKKDGANLEKLKRVTSDIVRDFYGPVFSKVWEEKLSMLRP